MNSPTVFGLIVPAAKRPSLCLPHKRYDVTTGKTGLFSNGSM